MIEERTDGLENKSIEISWSEEEKNKVKMNQFCEIFKTIPSGSMIGISEGNEKRKRKKIF